MDFIERLFGFSPDNGSGLFELALFLVPFFGLAILIAVQYARGRGKI